MQHNPLRHPTSGLDYLLLIPRLVMQRWSGPSLKIKQNIKIFNKLRMHAW